MKNKMQSLVKKVRNTKGGFTLIELIVVIAILAVLAAVLIPSITGVVAKATQATEKSNLQTAYLASQLAVQDLDEAGSAITADAVKTGAAKYAPSVQGLTVTLDGSAIKTVAITYNSKTITYDVTAGTYNGI